MSVIEGDFRSRGFNARQLDETECGLLQYRVARSVDFVDRIDALTMALQNSLHSCGTGSGEEAEMRSYHHRHACALADLIDDTVQLLKKELGEE